MFMAVLSRFSVRNWTTAKGWRPVRGSQTDGLERAKGQGHFTALGHDLDGQAALEMDLLLEVRGATLSPATNSRTNAKYSSSDRGQFR